ncbi:hypothetical protein JOD29_002016 [Lysinibacillus composti]|uniref:Uncharacterized protein n=1 Tax=Lysinibacillus composti TaxID=720633 RepID=A0A3N9UEF0_9BACI|nr:hypothetical protein [Lysinibacillus composti]MBM7608769.1 hypothetical protein [Lysinibacillus composti]RQW74673.1 hypothetical protein EBB45_10620 [Lysinibacillus composti]
MILKEFQMFENRGEYGKKFKDFTFETNCITTLYENNFPNFKTENTKKIILNCGLSFKDINITEHIDGFLEINIPYDVEEFFGLNDINKKIELLELLQIGVLWVCKEFNWDEAPFIETYEKIKNLNYECKYVWKKPKSCPNRKYKAMVECELTLYKGTVNLIVINKRNEIVAKKLVTEEKPNVFLFDMFLGELKWLSNEEVRLYRKLTRNPESNFTFINLKTN